MVDFVDDLAKAIFDSSGGMRDDTNIQHHLLNP